MYRLVKRDAIKCVYINGYQRDGCIYKRVFKCAYSEVVKSYGETIIINNTLIIIRNIICLQLLGTTHLDPFAVLTL